MSRIDSFNQNSVLQSLTAATPDELTALIRSIKMPVQILGFTSDQGRHTCYFRCLQKIVVKGKVAKPQGDIDG